MVSWRLAMPKLSPLSLLLSIPRLLNLTRWPYPLAPPPSRITFTTQTREFGLSFSLFTLFCIHDYGGRYDDAARRITSLTPRYFILSLLLLPFSIPPLFVYSGCGIYIILYLWAGISGVPLVMHNPGESDKHSSFYKQHRNELDCFRVSQYSL